jgi:hypothetical protein
MIHLAGRTPLFTIGRSQPMKLTTPRVALALVCLAAAGCTDSGPPAPRSHPPHFNRAYNWIGDAPLSPYACWRTNPPQPNCT